jgi:hypothetical protein
MINFPIPQYEYSGAPDLANERRQLCPKCRTVKQEGFNYSTVDTPPIVIQLEDNRRGVTREWQAMRCHCPSCNHFWDVVTVNKAKPDAPGETEA